jgi:CBS domain-containing protein
MIAHDLITAEIPPLKHSDTIQKALYWMDEFKVEHLPVLKGTNFVGVVSESDLMDHPDDIENSLDLVFDVLPRPFALETAHAYDVLKLIADHKITIVPVLDQEEKYLGCVDLLNLVTFITGIASITDRGGVVILKMQEHDYSMAEIAQIVESNNARILSSYITSSSDSSLMELTLKINTTNLDSILQTFYRYDYTVSASFQKSMFQDGMQDRYEELMKYLKL